MILNHGAPETVFKTGVESNLCLRCGNGDRSLFYKYHSVYDDVYITYCLHCIALGRSDSLNPLRGFQTRRSPEIINYHLDFKLNDIQAQASQRLVAAIKNNDNLMLYAVTGAGKTEITFEGIKYARS